MPRPAAALASNVCPIGVRLGASPHQCSVPPFVHLRHARGSLLSTPPIVLAGPLPHPLITFVGDVHHPQMVFVGALPRRHAAFLGVPPRAHVTLMQTPKRHHQKGGAPFRGPHAHAVFVDVEHPPPVAFLCAARRVVSHRHTAQRQCIDGSVDIPQAAHPSRCSIAHVALIWELGIDSFEGDLAMARIKMNAEHEYEYLGNYEIMQNVSKPKKTDKPIMVEKLVKCKMQSTSSCCSGSDTSGTPTTSTTRRAIRVRTGPNQGTSRTQCHTRWWRGPAQVAALTGQVRELSAHLEGLEKERRLSDVGVGAVCALAPRLIVTFPSDGPPRRADDALSSGVGPDPGYYTTI
ncbi:hypothetical protein DFH06DRAFT_1432689 [Mycena polygramma]|nr:hypothetical protein DFH06DRAFT_1432689 [Mycena polygramma]